MKQCKITYSKYLWTKYNHLDFYLHNFDYDDACPYCLNALSQYKCYNVALNKNYVVGADVTIYDFTINDKPYVWICPAVGEGNTIRAKFMDTPDNATNKTLEKLCRIYAIY